MEPQYSITGKEGPIIPQQAMEPATTSWSIFFLSPRQWLPLASVNVKSALRVIRKLLRAGYRFYPSRHQQAIFKLLPAFNLLPDRLASAEINDHDERIHECLRIHKRQLLAILGGIDSLQAFVLAIKSSTCCLRDARQAAARVQQSVARLARHAVGSPGPAAERLGPVVELP